jgi:hypothetical protein
MVKVKEKGLLTLEARVYSGKRDIINFRSMFKGFAYLMRKIIPTWDNWK